nr:RNA-dependent RNA polymerase [Dipteran tombus-related virus]
MQTPVDIPHNCSFPGTRICRRIMYRPSLQNPNEFFYYSQSHETSVASLLNRHLPITLPEYEPHLFRKQRFLKRFKTKCEPWTYEEYINSMDNSSKRNMYQRVFDDIQQGRPIRGHICPFTKLEKVGTGSYKSPRLIQARHPSFNLAYGRFIKPLEKKLKHRPEFGKGTYDNIAAKIDKHSRKWKYYTELDHKVFDAHITVEMLKLIHNFYLSCYANNPELLLLCKRTISNRAYGRHGEKYKIRGTRMSGDVDTSFGNCLLNYYILRSCLADLGIECEIIVNGDDSIIFTNIPLDPATIKAALRRYNMDAVISPSVTSIHKVTFCRTKLVYHPNGHPTMMFDPIRLRKIYGMTYKNLTNKQYKQYVMNVQHCNHTINSNSPLKYEWRILPDFNVAKLNDKQLKRVFDRQQTNVPWPDKILTPSVVEAYPDFAIRKEHVYLPELPKQKQVLINHMIQEIMIL